MPNEISINYDSAKLKNWKWRQKVGKYRSSALDPFSSIPSGLLSANEIVQYALKTGMIAPFNVVKDKKESRLKNASYEGRLGECAYWFRDDGTIETVHINDSGLEIPENSIWFVESDLEFRLPDFIAIRFNLTIRHVHRGLLLGTGPLVDPGFRGKLCIPIHNLTNEPYLIPKNEGLIWIEFTKTSVGKAAYGRGTLIGIARDGDNDDPGVWKPIEYIIRASRPVGRSWPQVPIQSSIPKVIEEAKVATRAVDKFSRQNTILTYGTLIGLVLGLASVVGAAVAIFMIYAGDMDRHYASIKENEEKISDLELKLSDTNNKINFLSGKISDNIVIIHNKQSESGERKENNSNIKPSIK